MKPIHLLSNALPKPRPTFRHDSKVTTPSPKATSVPDGDDHIHTYSVASGQQNTVQHERSLAMVFRRGCGKSTIRLNDEHSQRHDFAGQLHGRRQCRHGQTEDGVGGKEQGNNQLEGLFCICQFLTLTCSSNRLQDQYLRAIADYRNLQDRTKRETQAARDFALQRFGKDLVASIDNLEHALSSVSADKLAKAPPASQENVVETLHTDLVNMHKGLQLTETVLMETLKRHGLVRTDPAEQSEKFDPNIHEALFEAPMPGKTDGTVFVTQQKGFMLNGRVIRAPKVGVVRNS